MFIYSCSPADEVYTKIKELNSKLIIFTGAEPCLQAEELNLLIDKLKKRKLSNPH